MVLGGAPEPYVNNPLHVRAVTAEHRGAQKNKADWDKLVEVLDIVESRNDDRFTELVFDQILVEIHKLLAGVTVVYPTPNRIGLEATHRVIQDFLTIRSGGERTEAVSTALFEAVGEKFGIFDHVLRGKVNAADASSGMAADIECWLDDRIVLLVEVKDRSLTLTQLDTKLDTARSRRIAEVLFLAQKGIASREKQEVTERIRSEFTSGQNVYVTDFAGFSLGVLILLGEAGRVDFLTKVGEELDRGNATIKHRRDWAALLKEV
jgi:hypothetical protein